MVKVRHESDTHNGLVAQWLELLVQFRVVWGLIPCEVILLFGYLGYVSRLGLRTVPYYGYGRIKYGYFTGILPVNRTVKHFFSPSDGTVRVKKRVYGRFTGQEDI